MIMTPTMTASHQQASAMDDAIFDHVVDDDNGNEDNKDDDNEDNNEDETFEFVPNNVIMVDDQSNENNEAPTKSSPFFNTTVMATTATPMVAVAATNRGNDDISPTNDNSINNEVPTTASTPASTTVAVTTTPMVAAATTNRGNKSRPLIVIGTDDQSHDKNEAPTEVSTDFNTTGAAMATAMTIAVPATKSGNDTPPLSDSPCIIKLMPLLSKKLPNGDGNGVGNPKRNNIYNFIMIVLGSIVLYLMVYVIPIDVDQYYYHHRHPLKNDDGNDNAIIRREIENRFDSITDYMNRRFNAHLLATASVKQIVSEISSLSSAKEETMGRSTAAAATASVKTGSFDTSPVFGSTFPSYQALDNACCILSSSSKEIQDRFDAIKTYIDQQFTVYLLATTAVENAVLEQQSSAVDEEGEKEEVQVERDATRATATSSATAVVTHTDNDNELDSDPTPGNNSYPIALLYPSFTKAATLSKMASAEENAVDDKTLNSPTSFFDESSTSNGPANVDQYQHHHHYTIHPPTTDNTDTSKRGFQLHVEFSDLLFLEVVLWFVVLLGVAWKVWHYCHRHEGRIGKKYKNFQDSRNKEKSAAIRSERQGTIYRDDDDYEEELRRESFVRSVPSPSERGTTTRGVTNSMARLSSSSKTKTPRRCSVNKKSKQEAKANAKTSSTRSINRSHTVTTVAAAAGTTISATTSNKKAAPKKKKISKLQAKANAKLWAQREKKRIDDAKKKKK